MRLLPTLFLMPFATPVEPITVRSHKARHALLLPLNRGKVTLNKMMLNSNLNMALSFFSWRKLPNHYLTRDLGCELGCHHV